MTTLSPLLIALIVAIGIFDIVMRGFALWKAARNEQNKWFIALLIFSTAGILPMLYMKYFKKA